MNNFDKMCLMLTGQENKQLLDKCINPYFYDDNKPHLSEFNHVKNKIFTDLSINIFNYYQEKDM